MKLIDKFIIMVMGVYICLITDRETPQPLIGLLPIIYSMIYLTIKSFEEE